ncbi:MAG: uroporphyrinogen-III C-methyltransferase, partial [Clostridiales bacterium]
MNGKVYLIGAGPGDYGLITLKGMQLIETADVLVYDKLINKNLIYASPSHCEKIYVGKQAANHAMPQDQINEVLYQKAKEGKTVVRLKGGDPYVFGRGGEEGIYLVERNIPIEVVPGITSSIAGPCYAGIPVTHRDWASSFHVFTGNFKDEIRGLNFANLAELEGTLLFLMGFGNLNYITQGLIKAGKNKDTPVAVISKATTPQQHTVTGTLETIEQICKDEKMVPPAITLVGDVVKCREYLNFFESKKQKGTLILRDIRQSDVFAKKLMQSGFEPIVCPVIEIEKREASTELHSALKDIASYTWLIFTSPNGVKAFFELFRDNGNDFRELGHIKFATIGKATAEVLAKTGFKADYTPKKQISNALADGLTEILNANDKVLMPRSAIANNDIMDIISKKCS